MSKFRNFLFRFCFIFICCFTLSLFKLNSARGGIRQVAAEELKIYQFLDSWKRNFYFDFYQTNVVRQENKWKFIQFLYQCKMVEKLQGLLKKIIDGFNNDVIFYNPEIKYRFFNICNSINKDIKPHELRLIKKDIEEFSQYIKTYFKTRRRFLREADKELLLNIQKFNSFLYSTFLNSECFKMSIEDKLIDWCIYRPWELVAENPEITVGIMVLAAVLTYYFFFCNEKPIHPVTQLKAASQSGAECGQWAMYYNAILLHFDGDEEKMKKELEDKGKAQAFVELIKNKIKNRRGEAQKKADKVSEEKETKRPNGERKKADKSLGDAAIQRGGEMLSGGEIEVMLKDVEVREQLKGLLGVSDELIDNITVMEFGSKDDFVVRYQKKIVAQQVENAVKDIRGFMEEDAATLEEREKLLEEAKEQGKDVSQEVVAVLSQDVENLKEKRKLLDENKNLSREYKTKKVAEKIIEIMNTDIANLEAKRELLDSGVDVSIEVLEAMERDVGDENRRKNEKNASLETFKAEGLDRETVAKHNNDALRDKVDRFKTDKGVKSRGFVIRSGDHWFAAKFKKTGWFKEKLEAVVVDSMGYGQRNNKNLNQMFDWYNEKEKE